MDIEHFKGTMLNMVINTDFESCLELLLEQGVSANNPTSNLPLFFHAVSNYSRRCIILLLDRGANYTGFEKVSYYYNLYSLSCIILLFVF